jgi:hypothetical protein
MVPRKGETSELVTRVTSGPPASLGSSFDLKSNIARVSSDDRVGEGE